MHSVRSHVRNTHSFGSAIHCIFAERSARALTWEYVLLMSRVQIQPTESQVPAAKVARHAITQAPGSDRKDPYLDFLIVGYGTGPVIQTTGNDRALSIVKMAALLNT